MIKINKSETIPKPLLKKGAEATALLKKQYDESSVDYNSGKLKFDFKSSIYGHQKVKEQLVKDQYNKCCFCENRLRRAYGVVEHYRPKGACCQSSEAEKIYPGYYWLAYHWENLLLACEVCNTTYKRIFFPLTNNEDRVRNHHEDIDKEQPLLINPTTENPEEFIAYRGYIPYPIDDNSKGKTTINLLGLVKDEHNMTIAQLREAKKLNEDRIEHYEEIKDAYEIVMIANENPEKVEKYSNTIKKARLKLEKAQQPNAEYSLMIKCAIKDEFKY